MANPIAGWYPDPSGDKTKLRWWDGNQWTDNYADAVAQQPQPTQGQTAYAQPQQPQSPPQGYYQGQGGQSQGYGQVYQQPMPGYAQASNSSDDTLRLIAFILAVISTVSLCWAIIPLAWMIPMTVHTWGIYKRTKENTTAFGVCTLIFLNLIGGILLLVSTRNRQVS